MLSKLTLANAAAEDVVLHEDTQASKRLIEKVTGLVGIGPLRQTKRVRPQAHGSINETRYEEGRTIAIDGEVWGSSIEAALAEYRKITQAALETLDNGEALLKWTEGVSGNKLQMLVKLDSDTEPVLQEAMARVAYHVQFFAPDPRAYSQALTEATGATITGATTEQEWVKTTALYRGLAINATNVYFAGKGCIGRATLAGGTVEPEWIKGISTPYDIAVDATYVYWLSEQGIGRAKLAGTGIENEWIPIAGATQAFFTGKGEELKWVVMQAFAIDAGHVYWSYGAAGIIGRAAIGGGSIEREWIITSSGNYLTALAVNAANIFWTTNTTIGTATIAGAGTNNNFISTTGITGGLALDATYIYWTAESGNTLGRAKLAGTEVNQAFLSGLKGPTRVAVNSEHLYWNNTTTGYIGRNNLAGGPKGGALTISQAGNRNTPLVFKIRGPITDPSIMRTSDGSRIALVGTIVAGNYVEVNTAERTVRLNGTSNALAMLSAKSTNWEAFNAPPTPSSSTYELTATSATAAYMEMLYRSAYA
jgi:hypothetical protein